jgi:hypothetical protein
VDCDLGFSKRLATRYIRPEDQPADSLISGVVKGDCGSIIIDQGTFEVYGHVVGSDIAGHAHVVPLIHTIDQVKASFGACNVGLPLARAIIPRPLTPDRLRAVGGFKSFIEGSPVRAFDGREFIPRSTLRTYWDSDRIAACISNDTLREIQ